MPKRKNVGGQRKKRKMLTMQQGKGLATTVAKILGPILLKEVGSVGAKIIGKKVAKKLSGGRGNRGTGAHGGGLRLAGQRGPLRGRGVVLAGRGRGKKKRKRKVSQKTLDALARGRAIRMKNLGR